MANSQRHSITIHDNLAEPGNWSLSIDGMPLKAVHGYSVQSTVGEPIKVTITMIPESVDLTLSGLMMTDEEKLQRLIAGSAESEA